MFELWVNPLHSKWLNFIREDDSEYFFIKIRGKLTIINLTIQTYDRDWIKLNYEQLSS